MQRRPGYLFIARLLFFIVVLFAPLVGRAGLPVPPLPPLIVPVPPPVILVPGTYVYVAPDVEVDLLFYHGYWYRPYGGVWYRSSYYGGPWGFIAARSVPRVLINLPPGYRHAPPGQRIPYGQLKKNWRNWEQERHWDKPGKHEAVGKKGKRKRGSEVEEGGGGEHGRGHGRGR
jgi:hypothetical protein